MEIIKRARLKKIITMKENLNLMMAGFIQENGKKIIFMEKENFLGIKIYIIKAIIKII